MDIGRTPVAGLLSIKWRGASECDSLADPSSPKLSLAPLIELSLYPKEFPMAILVRESYAEMFHRLGVLLTGQPGTGKTLFLFYLLVCLLQQKQNVLFSLDGRQLFLFFHDAVYSAKAGMDPNPPTAKSSSPEVYIWSLFDI
ncbi:hypothetical protein BU17DRAFT_92637 [Hysterangium stoloniferum]|nr:hypothetical protein BU17DRAFT_92637 [Hysterangium stoloniferum]